MGEPAPRAGRLRTHLSALLVVTMLLTFAMVAGAVMAYRIPAIERETQQSLQDEVLEISERTELLLGTVRARLQLLHALLDDTPAEMANSVLDNGRNTTVSLLAVYRVSPQGQVMTADLPEVVRLKPQNFLNGDLSANPLFRAVSDGPAVVWSGDYRSVLSGTRCVGLAMRDSDGHVLIAELSLGALLSTVALAAGGQSSSMWIVERSGEVIADTNQGLEVGKRNIHDWPVMQATPPGRDAVHTLRFQGHDRHAAVAHAQALDWYFVGQAPMGWSNPQVHGLVLYVSAAFAGCVLTALLIAPFWARRMDRPVQQMLLRAALATAGKAQEGQWPRGKVAELNLLADTLEKMAATLQDREKKFQAIFNAAPVPMSVLSAERASRLLDVNEAWCRVFVRERERVIGHGVSALGLFASSQDEEDLRAAFREGRTSADGRFMRGNGEVLQARVFGTRSAGLKTRHMGLWAIMDTGPMHRIKQELSELNQQLEARVAQRTEALAVANQALSQTAEQLRVARDELVRAGKMAALGNLVAGVAHELNTPLGNGVMAISAMADATRHFKVTIQGGLKRADLQHFVDSVEQGADIAGRNLHRAADLVQSFKQVAVDQTHQQRRSFELIEVVTEMVVSLRPTFHRTPYRIEVNVPQTGLWLDSYPGALGQAIGNLIQNAVVHGFDGRAHGCVCIDAERAGDGAIVLRVADDGCGIPAANLGRIFDPFMTTRMGRGGTGLGLHISYNAVVNLLGGTLSVQSREGEGACFTLRLPAQAPHDQKNAGLT